jgi:hypothetical protein
MGQFKAHEDWLDQQMEETQQLIEALSAQAGIPLEVSLPGLSPFA